MGVERFRSVDEMPRMQRVSGDELPVRIRALWQRAFRLCPRPVRPGVRRFRSIEEANAERLGEAVDRMRRRATGI